MQERLMKFITQENLSATRFADEVGVQRSSISHILSGRNKPSYDFIQKILTRYPIINADWLLLGKGKMYKESNQAGLLTKPSAPDLFSQLTTPSSVNNDVIEPSTTVEDEPVNPEPSGEADKPASTPLSSGTLNERNVKRVIIFYSDGTFSDYRPEND